MAFSLYFKREFINLKKYLSGKNVVKYAVRFRKENEFLK